MKDVLTALSAEVFKPLMTVVLPGTVSISTLLVTLFLRFDRLRAITESRRPETAVVVALLALIAGEISEDLGSRIEHGFDCYLRKQKKNDKLEYPNFDDEWAKYLRFNESAEPIGIRYIRSLVLRLKFELGMCCGFFFCALGLFAVGLKPFWLYRLVLLAFGTSAYFLWEAFDTHEVLADTRRLLFATTAAIPDIAAFPAKSDAASAK